MFSVFWDISFPSGGSNSGLIGVFIISNKVFLSYFGWYCLLDFWGKCPQKSLLGNSAYLWCNTKDREEHLKLKLESKWNVNSPI